MDPYYSDPDHSHYHHQPSHPPHAEPLPRYPHLAPPPYQQQPPPPYPQLAPPPHDQQPPPPYPHLAPPPHDQQPPPPYPHLAPPPHHQAPYQPTHETPYHHQCQGSPPTHEAACKGPSHHVVVPQEGKLFYISPKANQGFALSVRNNGVVMVPANSKDASQMWMKDESCGRRVQDSYGFPAFALVNKGSGKALKHAQEKGLQALVEEYRPGMLEESTLWTESQDMGDGFTTIRSARYPLLNLTIFQGETTGGLRNGSPLTMDTWHKYDSQLWKIFPL